MVAPRPNASDTVRATRVLGQCRGDAPGSTLICVASLHGNEPAGLTALIQVFEELARTKPPIRGEVVGLAGNLKALERRQRFIDLDLNRCWTRERIQSWRAGRPQRLDAEEHEAAALLLEIEEVIARARGDVHVIDLHTTSGASTPFGTIGDTLRNRDFALRFPVPTILGLEEHLDGTLLEHLNNLGHITMGFEAGQHDDPSSVQRAEQCVWVALEATGILENARDVPDVTQARHSLGAVSHRFPRVLEVRYRHAVDQEDRFQMEPGYASFQPVRAGELVARDRSGSIYASETGRVLMPLYQPQGDDGFFLMREFKPFWLTVSALLRGLRLDSILHWLPGVERVPNQPNTLTINRRIARWFALQVFHLLGYRKRRMQEDMLVVSRRRHD